MYTMKSYIIAAIIALTLLGGCSDGSNGGDTGNSNTGSSTEMVVGTVYSVESGDKLVPSSDAVLNVKHAVSSNAKSVTLLSGTATLLTGSYAL